jgi:hypothetical protein
MNIRPEIVVLLLAVIAGLFLAFRARGFEGIQGAPYFDMNTGQLTFEDAARPALPAPQCFQANADGSKTPIACPSASPATATPGCYRTNADGSTTAFPCPQTPVTCYQANADGSTTAFPCPGTATATATAAPAPVPVVNIAPPSSQLGYSGSSGSSNLLSSQYVNNLPTQECVLKRPRTSQMLNAQGQMQEIITGYDEFRSNAPECQTCPQGQARVGGVCRSNFDYNYNDQGILGVFKGRDDPFTQIVEDDYTGPGLVTPGSQVNFVYGGSTTGSGIVVSGGTVTTPEVTPKAKTPPAANVCGVPSGVFARKEASGTCVSKIDPDDAEKGDIKKFLDLAIKDIDGSIMDNAVLAEIIMFRTPTNRRTYHFLFISEADAKNAAVFANFDVGKPATALFNKPVYQKYVIVHATVDNGNPLAPKVTGVVTPKNDALPAATKCPAGQTRVGSACTAAKQTKPDPRCAAGSGKVMMRTGACACPPGQTDKAGTCVWTASGIQPTRCIVSTANKKFPYYRPRRGQACVPCNPKNGCRAKVM